MPKGISIREFARRDGCSDTLVRRALKAGRLSAFDDRSLDPALVGTGWRLENRKAANVSVRGVRDGETVEEAALRLVTGGGVELVGRARAEELKENYLYRLRELEYDQKSGAVVPIDKVAEIVGAKFSAVRTRLLAIPAEQAPRLHRLKTVAEVQEALLEIITEALEEIVNADVVAPAEGK